MSKGIIIGSIIGVLIIVAIVVGVIVANQKGIFDKEPQKNSTQIELFINGQDSETGNFIDANYILDYSSNQSPIIINKGNLRADSYIPIILDADKVYHVNCWNENHYFVKASKSFAPEEIEQKKARFSCSMVKIGDLEISSEGNLKAGVTNEIKFKVKSNGGWFYKLSGCISWSAGIIDAYLQNNLITCESGSWLNWSYYNSTLMKYIPLAEGTYRCGEEQIEKCEAVSGNRCKVESIEKPSRFLLKTDGCFYTGKSLAPNETFEFTIEVKTLDYMNALDFLEITFFDYDRRYSDQEGMFTWTSEEKGVDIAGKDKVYRIEYK